MAKSEITKAAIHDAFLSVVSEKPVNKVTVRDITERCGVNRNTFYYHYHDIPELLEEICESAVSDIIEQHPTISSLDECITAVMKFELKNKKAVKHICNSDISHTYVSALWHVSEYAVTRYMETIFPDAGISDDDKRQWIRIMKCTVFGLTADWIAAGMKDEDIEKVRNLSRHMRGVSDVIIANCLKDEM